MSWAERSSPPHDERPELGRNLTYGLLDSLGRAIVAGEFEREPFPVEAELVRRYGVSLSVTREAVKMLSAKGLLTARPRQGTLVQPTTSWNLFDTDVLRWLLDRKFAADLLPQLTQLRIAIEPEAASFAAHLATAEDGRRIEQALERVIAAAQGEDEPLPAGIAFHVAVLRATQNPFYAQFRDVVSTALRASMRFRGGSGSEFANVRDYIAVHTAIRTSDADGARTAMRNLITGSAGTD
jgi:DNA-binding FadR family transcriptional regulator